MNLQEIKEQIAEEEGYGTWGHFLRTATEDDAQYCIDKLTTLYAIEKVKEALKLAAERACDELELYQSEYDKVEQSILSLETQLIERINKEK